MTVSTPDEIIIHADAEHGRLRTVVMLILLVSFVLIYWLVQMLFRLFLDESPLILVCGLALPTALGAGWLVEKMLKRVWHSGRCLTIDDNGIRATNLIAADLQLRWAVNLTHLSWSFKLSGYPRGGRERRLPANYHCLAVQLQQGGQYLVVHTYLSSGKAEKILEGERVDFVKLDPGEVYKTSARSRFFTPPERPDIPSKVIAGANGRYWLAEKRRWLEGFELEPKDFEQFLKLVEENSQ